jgi:hypothetical protein
MAPRASLASEWIVFIELSNGRGWSACVRTRKGRVTGEGASKQEAHEALGKLLNTSVLSYPEESSSLFASEVDESFPKSVDIVA